jgi:hypothetical protein
MFGRPARLLVVGFGLMAAAMPSAAQTQPAQPVSPQVRDSDDEPLRSGAGVPGVGGYPGRGLSVSAQFSSRYESNLGRINIVDDGFRIRPQLDAAYGLGLGRQGLFVRGTVARDVFIGTEQFGDRDRLSVSGGLDYRLSRCSGQAGAGWQRNLVLETDAGRFGGFEQARTNAGVTLSCRIGNALTVDGSVTRFIAESTGNAANVFDVRSWTYSAGLGFGGATLGRFSVNGSITDTDMPGRLVITPDGLIEDGLRQRSVRVGYQRTLGSKISLGLGISYIDTTPASDLALVIIEDQPQVVERERFSGLGFDGSLDLQLSNRLGFSFTATRRAFANPIVGAQFTIATNYAASVSYRLNQRYSLSAGGSRRSNSFRGSFVSSLDPQRRQSDTLERYFAQLSGKFGRRLTLSLDVAHNRRRSEPSLFNFSSTGVGLNLGFDFGRGSR